jgi:nucleotide-binding universal stress UspA family protein
MRILLALDGSPSSIQARDLVAALRWPPGTVIRLATAYEVPIDWSGGLGAGMAWVGDAEDAVRDELTAELGRLAEPLAGHDWQVDRQVVSDRPASAIIDTARDFEADLIALGSRGRGPLTSMLLGSVSAEVVDHAACSVLVARGEQVSRLLIATDGSDAARAIPDRLGAWGVFRGLAAEALSVAPLPERTFELLADVYTLGQYRFTDDRQELLDRHRGFAEQLAQQLAEQHIPATSSVMAGDAAHEIIDAARRRGADLIVTGTRGLHGLERVILGSVARNVVLHAPCSVIVVRGISTAPGATGKRSHSADVSAPKAAV